MLFMLFVVCYVFVVFCLCLLCCLCVCCRCVACVFCCCAFDVVVLVVCSCLLCVACLLFSIVDHSQTNQTIKWRPGPPLETTTQNQKHIQNQPKTNKHCLSVIVVVVCFDVSVLLLFVCSFLCYVVVRLLLLLNVVPLCCVVFVVGLVRFVCFVFVFCLLCVLCCFMFCVCLMCLMLLFCVLRFVPLPIYTSAGTLVYLHQSLAVCRSI